MIYVYVYVFVHIYIYIYTYICIFGFIYNFLLFSWYVCVCAHTCVHMRACVCVCVCGFFYIKAYFKVLDIFFSHFFPFPHWVSFYYVCKVGDHFSFQFPIDTCDCRTALSSILQSKFEIRNKNWRNRNMFKKPKRKKAR